MNSSQPSSISLTRTPGATAPFVAVAGLSARLLAQSARRAGLRVAALDIFGDRDTRQAAQLWFDIGGGALAIDPARLVDALQRVARLPGLLGWIGGSGLEPLAAPLNETPGLPAWIGNTAQAVAAVRDPRRFFALLDTLHIAHPEIRFTPPAPPSGWLYKAADGCGGLHIEAAAAHRPPYDARRGYFQRLGAGRSLSALFIAARRQVTVLGFAEQLTRASAKLPFVHEGSIGPIEMPPRGAARVTAALQAIVAHTGLSGLNSFDFLLDGDTVLALEVNARPSSTLALYETAWPQAWPRGLLAQHIDACRHGILAPPPPPHAGLCVGQQVWLAPRPLIVSERFSDACLADPACRDVPLPGTLLEPGQPICTLLVRAASASAVPRALERQRGLVLQRLENCHEPDYAFIQCHS